MDRPLKGAFGKNNTDDNLEEFDLEQMQRETEEMLLLVYLKSDNARFAKTDGGFVSLDFDSKHYDRVGFYKGFPFSDPEKFISVREPDEKAREIGIIADLKSDFDQDTQSIIREQMKLRYFTPVILKINKIKTNKGFAYYDVVTNNGKCKFVTSLNGAVISLSETRVIINDLDGNRFEIPDLSKLTPKELKLLDVFL